MALVAVDIQVVAVAVAAAAAEDGGTTAETEDVIANLILEIDHSFATIGAVSATGTGGIETATDAIVSEAEDRLHKEGVALR